MHARVTGKARTGSTYEVATGTVDMENLPVSYFAGCAPTSCTTTTLEPVVIELAQEGTLAIPTRSEAIISRGSWVTCRGART
jgi:hypothetical protein